MDRTGVGIVIFHSQFFSGHVLNLNAVFILPLFPEPIMKIHVCCSKHFLVLYSDDKVERFIYSHTTLYLSLVLLRSANLT